MSSTQPVSGWAWEARPPRGAGHRGGTGMRTSRGPGWTSGKTLEKQFQNIPWRGNLRGLIHTTGPTCNQAQPPGRGAETRPAEAQGEEQTPHTRAPGSLSLLTVL